MAPIARDSWTLSSSVFTVHEVCAPCPPVIFESPIRSRALSQPTAPGDDSAAGSQPWTSSMTPLRLEAQFDSALEESSEPSTDANIIDNLASEKDNMSLKKATKKSQSARGKSCKLRKAKKTLSVFEELMLKLNAVDGPQLVLQITRLEDMSPAEVEANFRAH